MQNIIATRIWLALIALTFFAYILSAQGLSGRAFVLTVLMTSLIKGQMIIDHYMMLKAAPLLWRIIISTWLLIVLTTIMGMYYAFG
jgi:hypothetical protein